MEENTGKEVIFFTKERLYIFNNGKKLDGKVSFWPFVIGTFLFIHIITGYYILQEKSFSSIKTMNSNVNKHLFLPIHNN
jgi:hypothetical protein